ncbi:NAD(P) transhydrogenase subunit alpha [Halobacteriovorax marinus]|uniref:proton-translocating NAD(P)(+) transhydrogenase n=1 Tax=Halobacteriovorax marinus TaxID=97084 RepID=A0A1Y5F9L5_9BACT|nr:NAD(P) transhydrogenase subunit alpha [Halobacteriovorax marinus]
MNLGFPTEKNIFEKRVALTPKSAKELIAIGISVFIEAGYGLTCHFSDEDYSMFGVVVLRDKNELYKLCQIIARIGIPSLEEISAMNEATIHISYLDPFNQTQVINKFLERNISAFSLEMIPRVSKAQKMDVLSSQTSLAGYTAVIMAADRSPLVFPMMITPAGTISASKVFVIGVGVAGLQAIATAKRLGAIVEAFDTRPVVEEQVKSLGAKFVKMDLGDTGQTAGGYAKQLTKEQVQKQRDLMAKHCINADIVITTAQLFGKKAPIIVTKEVVSKMKPGSVIVDLAASTGGNVEGVILNKETNIGGVLLIGHENYPANVHVHASQMLASNIASFIEDFWDKENCKLVIDQDNEIIKGSLISHNGEIVNSIIKEVRFKNG